MYTVTRQRQWPDGAHLVAIPAGSFDYTTPDAPGLRRGRLWWTSSPAWAKGRPRLVGAVEWPVQRISPDKESGLWRNRHVFLVETGEGACLGRTRIRRPGGMV
jgi:hypothetical protein